MISLVPYAGAAVVLLAFLAGMVVAYFIYHYYLMRHLSRRLGRQSKDNQSDIASLKELNKTLEANARALQAKDLELTMANKRLADLEAAKSKFVAVTTHQLRTPLAAIKWTLHLIKTGQLGQITLDQQTFINKAYQSTERIIHIVNNLLRVDDIGANKDDYTLTLVNLTEIIESVIFEFTAPAQSKNLKFKFDHPTYRLPDVKADPLRLRMVFENLIDNAIKYTPQRGSVMVKIDDSRLNATPRSLLISVADTGAGISAEDQGKIFSKFFRGQAAVAEPDGSGLGLYIAKDIVERHGGSIWFETLPGGTIFFVDFPVDGPKSVI